MKKIKEKFKKIFPLEKNLEIKNFFEYFKRSNIKISNNNLKKIFFLDAASYNNIGDQAIAYAMEVFINENFKDYEYIEISEKDFLRNFFYLKKHIKSEDIICLTGGGNFGNLYPRYEAIRRKIVKNFKLNRIIVFPQTIDYESNKYGQRELRRSKKVYNSNENVVLCAREEKSYKMMKELYKNVKLIPDIVLYLVNKLEINNDKKYEIGICLRKDKESIISEKDISEIEKIEKNSKILTTIGKEKLVNRENRKNVLMKKINEFSECKLIITDRLHGMIFAIIANIPCIALDNSNHKVSGVYETIKKYLNNVKVIKEYDKTQLLKIINEIKNKKNDFKMDCEYEKLIKIIKDRN